MRILTVGPVGVVAMQRVLDWLASREADVWVVDADDTYRALVPAGFRFSALPAAPRSGRIRRAIDGALPQRRCAAWPPTSSRRSCICTTSPRWGWLAQQQAWARCWSPPGARWAGSAGQAAAALSPATLRVLACGRRPDCRRAGAPRTCPGASPARRCVSSCCPWVRTAGAFSLAGPRRRCSGAPCMASPTMPSCCSPRACGALSTAIRPSWRPMRWPIPASPGRRGWRWWAWATVPTRCRTWPRPGRRVANQPAAQDVRWLPRIRYQQMPTLYALSDAVINYPEVGLICSHAGRGRRLPVAGDHPLVAHLSRNLRGDGMHAGGAGQH